MSLKLLVLFIIAVAGSYCSSHINLKKLSMKRHQASCRSGYSWDAAMKLCVGACPAGFVRIPGTLRCVMDGSSCSSGYSWDATLKLCVGACPAGFVRIPGTLKCAMDGSSCPSGYSWDASLKKCVGNCPAGFVRIPGTMSCRSK